MTDQTSTLRIQADASGVEAGVATAKRSLASLGGAAAQAGKQGADGLVALGNGGDAAARKVDSATKSMVGSIQRQIAAMEAGGTSSRQYQESLAKLRGIDVSALKPYLDQLDAAKVKATAAAKATDGLKSAASGIRGTLAALGVSLSAGAFLAFVANINNGVDALNDLKDATGASIENISALEDVARRTGTSFDTVGTALIKLNQGLSAAKPGSDTERAIKAIGLSVAELKTLDPAEAFRRIAVSLSGFEDDANKARLTQELFGKSLKEVAPLLKDLADQGQLNATVTTAQAEAAEKLNKQIFNLQKNALDAGRAITGALVPALSDGVERFLLAQKHAGGLLETLGLYARLDYSKGFQGNLGNVEKQIAALEERAGRITSDSVRKGNDKAIADLRAQAAYLKELRQIKILEEQGDVGDAVSRKYQRKVSVADIGGSDGGKAAAKALADQNRELAEQAKLLATLSGVNGDYQEQLTRLQVVRKSQNLSDARYSELVTELIDKQPMVKALYAEQEKSAKAWEDQAKASARAVAELSKDYDAYVKTLDASAASVEKQVQALQDEEAATLIAAQQNISLAQAIEQVTIARLKEAQTKSYANGDQEAGDAIKREIEARKKLATAIGGKEVREANKKAAEDAAKEGQKTADKINDSITDALMRGFEDGKGFAQNMRDTIENIFKTMVLRPVVQATVNTGLGALGIPGVGSAGGGSGGLFDTASNAYGLYNKASSFFGGGASSAFGFAGMAGAGTAAGATAVLPAVTTAAIEAGITAGGASIYSLGAAAGAAGVSLPTFGAGLGGSFGGAAGATTLGTTVAAPLAGGAAPALGIPGIGWAIGGALLLAGLLGGGGGRYVQSTGETSLNFDESGKETSRAAYRFQGIDEATAKEYGMKYVDLNEGANNFATSLNKTYIDAAKSLGITAAASNFAYGGNDADSTTGQGKFRLGAGVVGGKSYFNSGEIAKSDEALKLAASRAVLTALSGSEMPKYLAGVFDSVGDIATNSQAQIDAVLATAQSFKALHDSLSQLPFDNLKDQTYAVYKALTDAAGGLEQFGQKLSGYYDNFYSAEEKRTQTLKGISKRLADGGINVGVDALEKMSRADFRALFETIQTTFTGQASTGMVAALLDVQGAFASVTAASADAATALASTRKALLDAATGAASSALSGLTKSVEAQKSALTSAYDLQVGNFNDQLTSVTGSVGKLQSLASSLKGTLDGLRIAGSEGQYRAAAQAQISAALAIAKAGGPLPLDGQLTTALQTVSRPSEQLFATFTDYARDFYKTANEIAALGDLTGAQLTADEVTQGLLQDQIDLAKRGYDAQVKGLDETVNIAQQQLEAANGTYAAILTLSDAIKASTAATQALLQERAGQGLATGTVVGGALQPVKPDAARLGSINQYINTLDFSESGAAASVQALYSAAQQYGVNQTELAAASGYALADVQKLFAKYGIPAFDVGTNYVPQDMLAQIHKGEAIIPAAYNPAAGGQGAGNTARLEALVEKLTAEVAAMRAAADATANNTGRTASTLVNVTQGGKAMQTEAYA